MPKLLSLRRLSKLPPAMLPRYNPDVLVPGIIHIGCGVFHRAHQALYTELALAAAPGDWGIIGANLHHRQARDLLLAQNGLYTVLEQGPQASTATLIACLHDLVFAPEDATRLPYLMAQPPIKLVSLTVGENGYCRHPLTGELDLAHQDIVHDLEHPMVPVSIVGTLVAGLRARRLVHGEPITILCCDDLPRNGVILKNLVIAFAERSDHDTAHWIARNVAFPSSVAERLAYPADAAALAEVRTLIGMEDAAAVSAEPFKRWVIEDNFAAGRPQWEAGGAELVADTVPYEQMKLRLFDAACSMLGYLGHAAGDEHIGQTMADPASATLLRRFLDEEAAPALPQPAVYDLTAYKAQVLARLTNPHLAYRCDRIVADGSQKLPQRLLDTVRNNLEKGRSVQFAALAVAAWMHYAGGVDKNGAVTDVKDAMADSLRTTAQEDATHVVDRLLRIERIFGDDLPRNAVFRTALIRALETLRRDGSRRTVAEWTQTAI
jgi:fructuronate reductase